MELGELGGKRGTGETHLLMCEILKKHTLSPYYESKKDVSPSNSTELDDILGDFFFQIRDMLQGIYFNSSK